MASFIQVPPENHFPIQNLPYSTGILPGNASPVCVSRIGDYVINLAFLESQGVLGQIATEPVFNQPTLNKFMSLGRDVWRTVRSRLQELLSDSNPQIRDNQALREGALVPIEQFQYTLAVDIGDYTDFYASKNHAFNVGCLFRDPSNALQPNWTRLPVGYHGRASSVKLWDTPVIRPRGQIKPPDADSPIYTACRRLDYEVEIGFFVGSPVNDLGTPIPISRALDSIFGLVILNDWSARDIQAWEYVPLGPFNAKNFLTTISPWIVTLEALEPFRAPLPPQDPEPLPYLKEEPFAYDIQLKTLIQTPQQANPVEISQTNMRHLYWSISQQLAHHTVTGCNLRVGDLMGTGTISGPDTNSLGCLLEITKGGKEPLDLGGETRTFLQDGDSLTITGECQGQGFTVGFGETRSVVLPAIRDEFYQG